LPRLRGFRFDKQHDIDGAVYVAGSALNDVYELRAAGRDLNAVFERLISVGLGVRPTVVILGGGHEAVLCPNGVENEQTSARIPLRSVTVSRASVDSLLNEFYENWLQTPQDFAPVWHSARRRVPVENTEKVIEGLLFPFARATFRTTHVVRREDEMLSGRADISILPRPDRIASGSCVVELKVLRSRRYHLDPGKAATCPAAVNEQAIVDGLNQGLSYRQDLSCELAFLCCYDMRSENSDTILQQYATEASTKKVDLRRYYLYGSSKEYRGSKPDAVPRRQPKKSQKPQKPSGHRGRH
jgi:hypothetical protein